MWVLRTAAKMFLTLGLAGTFVAVLGLYGVRSYLVSRRTREFGVRASVRSYRWQPHGRGVYQTPAAA